MRKLLFILSFLLFLQACSSLQINVVPSAKKDLVPRSVTLSTNLTITSWGAISIIKIDMIPSSFRIESKGKVIYIDPVDVDGLKPADYIFITHTHGDHFSLPDIDKLLKKDTLIICPHMAVEFLSKYRYREVSPGEAIQLEAGIKCEIIAAYNLNNFSAHPKANKNVGYVISLNGKRIYHAGDTDFIPEMNAVKNITLAFVPIGVGALAMDPLQASKAVNLIKPTFVIPMHYELDKDQPELFKGLVDKGSKVYTYPFNQDH